MSNRTRPEPPKAAHPLEIGHSLKAIADILGHRLLATTFIYTKVDFCNLEQVALEWPEVVEWKRTSSQVAWPNAWFVSLI